MNWLDSAIRSSSTRCALDRYVTLGTPSADAVARTAGIGPGEAALEVGRAPMRAGRVTSAVLRTAAPGRRARRLVELLVDLQLDAHDLVPAASAGAASTGCRRRRSTASKKRSLCSAASARSSGVGGSTRPHAALHLDGPQRADVGARHGDTPPGAEVVDRDLVVERRSPRGRAAARARRPARPRPAAAWLAVGAHRADDQAGAAVDQLEERPFRSSITLPLMRIVGSSAATVRGHSGTPPATIVHDGRHDHH